MLDNNLDSERSPLRQNDQQAEHINQTDNNTTEQFRQAKRKKYIKWGIIGALILIALILVIVLPIVLTRKGDGGGGGGDGPIQPPLDKQNPYSVDKGTIKNDQVSFSGVLKVGNHASRPVNAAKSASTKDTTQHKSFFHDRGHIDNIIGKKVLMQEPVLQDDPPKPDPPTPSGKLAVDWTKQLKVDKNNQFAFNLKFGVEMLGYKTARFTLTDNDNARFSIPDNILNKPNPDQTMRLEMLGFNPSMDPFGFSFSDVTDKTNVYVSTIDQTLVFMDKYIQMDMLLPTQNIYGFGERTHEFGLSEGTYTMWASGYGFYDDGKGRKNSYGVHPFLLVQSKKQGDFFGIYFRNANAQSPIIRFNDDGTSTLSYITIGGQLEVYFFIHGSVKDILREYHGVIGKPTLPPFWSMGWQQASWKYTTQDLAQASLKGYKDAKMPLDVIYFDIPYMNNFVDFTVDTKAFPDLKTFSQNLNTNNQKLVVIVDAAISAEDTDNKYYKQGTKDSVFIQSSIHQSDKYGKNLIQQVWPKLAVFLDWYHDKIQDTWGLGLTDLHNQVAYDGLWLDMNEPDTFVDGEIDHNNIKQENKVVMGNRLLIGEDTTSAQQVKDDPYVWFDSLNGNIQNTFDTYNLPFVVRNSENNAGNWDNATISLNATHPGLNNEKEYNLHSLYGHMMARRTREFLETQGDNRPFIVSRSTFASSGRYTSHWLGDNYRTWEYLKYSISGIMNMNMFGITHAGADVCGFFGEKLDQELCLRWIQLATFYPYARSHQNQTYKGTNSDNSEPFNLKDKYLSDARSSMYDRYSYLRMMYTCMYEVTQNGGSCFDPLFYHFPNDKNLFTDYESNIMVANNLKVSPILAPIADGVTTYKSYFPQGKWVNMADLTEVIDTSDAGKTVDLQVRSTINAHLKAGGLIPWQNTGDGSVLTTADLLKKPIALIANRDKQGHAEGTVFLDQGISRAELDNSQYEHYSVKLQAKSFQFKLLAGTSGKQNHILSELLIADAADLKDTTFACGMNAQMDNQVSMKVQYIGAKKLLKISPDTDKPVKFSDISNIYFGGAGDLNLCDPFTFSWKVKGDLPDLSASSVTLTLQNLANTSPDLSATIAFIDQNLINVKWTYDGAQTPAGKRTPVEVPKELVDTSIRGTPSQKLSDFIQITANPFKVQFLSRNKLDQTPYYTINGFLLDSYLNWINAQVTVPSGDQFKGIWGLGERAYKNFFYEDGVYTIWGKDQGTPFEDGKPPAKAMYGTHPFFMFRHAAQSYAGVFYKLAHAQDWYIQNNKNTGVINLKTVATGGLGDIYIMTDQQNPQTIIERYYSIVGDPVLIPQWALGWNQCKWGYKSVQDLQDSVDGYKKNNIPLDVQWSDIDYMSNYKDFTYDDTAFKGLPDFVDAIHKNNQKFVPILDIGVAMRPGSQYKAYEDGIKDDVFIKIKPAGADAAEPFIGKVWPNEAVYPDFFNPKTTPWWHAQLTSMYNQFKFDGLWEDMNEVSNFCDGVCFDKQKPEQQVKNLLPYTPSGADLEVHTAPLDAVHANGYLQLDTHSYHGTQEVKATHEWFRDVQKQRTFIIERSSFAGMGKFGSRWLGDNNADYDQMGISVTGIMQMHMFGIQLAGVDICGFGGNTTPELCARWHTLGAFYPFSRNHNSIGQKAQEPWQFLDKYEGDMTFMDVMRAAIQQKYSMIRYFYTQMFLASLGTAQNYRKALYKPMFFEFPEDLKTYDDLMHNVMLGDALKLSINSNTQGSTTTDYYFPAGTWCDIHKPELKCVKFDVGTMYTLPSKAYDFGLHLREGYLIPYQDAKALKAMTTVDLQNQPVDFHILGSKTSTDNNNWRSSGVYVNDDGISLDITDKWNRYDISVNGQFTADQELITVKFSQSVSSKTVDKDKCNAVNKNDYLNSLYIYNAKSFKKSDKFDVNGLVTTETGAALDKLGTASYDDATDRIIFTKGDVEICLSKYTQITFTPQKK